jgi:uncharacterized membrane protein YsdA (DUF1294 family)
VNALWWVAPVYIILINAITYLMFWNDKERAQLRLRRISEGHLLTLAMLGGSPAALFARQYLRHKTRKQPFATLLILIFAIQASALIWLALQIR